MSAPTPRVPLEQWVAQTERQLAESWRPRPAHHCDGATTDNAQQTVRHIPLWEQEADEAWEP